jgi:AGZA family xanthine/uracil permease-like MFS transporter
LKPYRWATSGDVNAFFGLMLDNVAGMVLAVSLLAEVFKFPAQFALRHMIPGTALGVLVGDLAFTLMAIRLARRTGRNDITAMPLGLDTPSTFGLVLFVVGPAFVAAKQSGLDETAAARHAWHIGMCAILLSGLFKIACAFVAGWARRMVPRAGLLGSLAAVALVLISFMPLVEIFHEPLVGMISLALILGALVARLRLPGRMPGALAALLVGSALYYLLVAVGLTTPDRPAIDPAAGLLPLEWLEAFSFDWLRAMRESLQYLPIVLPFALGTVIGGIDCTESAAAAGDEYHTGWVVGVEGIATVIAALFGGVIQTTPYIGHPAYKAMGGRAAYTLATALFIGSAGLLGYFGYIYLAIAKPTVFPILVFIGLEITSQSFHATPIKHYPAVAFGCAPALASLVMLFVDNVLGQANLRIEQLAAPLNAQLLTLRVLAGGFFLTSLLWASTLAAIIDKQLRRAAVFLAITGLCALFGMIHSPFPGNPLVLPWSMPEMPEFGRSQTPVRLALAYGLAALLLLAWEFWLARSPEQTRVEGESAPEHRPREGAASRKRPPRH